MEGAGQGVQEQDKESMNLRYSSFPTGKFLMHVSEARKELHGLV